MPVDLDPSGTTTNSIMGLPEGHIGTTGGKKHGDGQTAGACPDDADFRNGTGGMWHEWGLRR